MKVRTRVAPSPTGDPHVGTAYVALLNYCFAKQHGGQFLLRIEDTDRNRSTAASENVILDALHWLGLQWDEGPDVGGPYGPYRQSERLPLYAEYAKQLLDTGHAFRCFCSPERLAAMRENQRRRSLPPSYDGLCLTLTQEEVASSEAAQLPFVVRLRVPRDGSVIVDDLLRGPIEFEWSTVDMQVLVKSDGWPTYHLANVVDDHLMDITHVMRGEEWISSAPKHLLLYRAFGWDMPKIAHLPLLRNADKSKLSKRKNPTSILFYERMGYLPEALTNFLGLFCVPPQDGVEIMDLPTLVKRFGFSHIALGGPVFDVKKLDWLNARYIREELDVTQLAARVRDWALNSTYLEAIAPLVHQRIERLSDLGPLCAFLFAGRIEVSAEQLRAGKLHDETLRKAFVLALAEFDASSEWNAEAAQAAVRRVGELLDVKLRDVVRPFYLAMSGSAQSLPLFEAMALLGRDLVRERCRVALERLGGATNSESDAWKRERRLSEVRISGIVLAAGKGTRMHSARPKMLHALCGRPMLWYALRALHEAGVADVTVVTSRELEPEVAAVAASAGHASVRAVLQEPQLGTGHAVGVALADRPARDGTVIVLNGDMPLVDADLVRATLAACAGSLALVTARMPLPSSFGRIVRDGPSVARIVEARDASGDELALDEMNAGLYAFDEAKLRSALTALRAENAQSEYYLTDTIAHLASLGERIVPVTARDYRTVLGVNDRVELAAAAALLNRRLCEEHMRAGVTIVDPATTYLEPGLEISADVTIRPNTALGRGTRIGAHSEVGPNSCLQNARVGEHAIIGDSIVVDSAIGDFALIGPWAHVRGGSDVGTASQIGNYVELKAASLAPGVKARHLAYVGDATVGERTNVGAGTITCNYDGKRKNRTTIGKDVFIGSNSSLVAPLTIGDGAQTGAGTVVIRDVPAGARFVGNPARQLPSKEVAGLRPKQD